MGVGLIGVDCMVWRLYPPSLRSRLRYASAWQVGATGWVILTFTGSGEWMNGFVDEWIDAEAPRGRPACKQGCFMVGFTWIEGDGI